MTHDFVTAQTIDHYCSEGLNTVGKMGSVYSCDWDARSSPYQAISNRRLRREAHTGIFMCTGTVHAALSRLCWPSRRKTNYNKLPREFFWPNTANKAYRPVADCHSYVGQGTRKVIKGTSSISRRWDAGIWCWWTFWVICLRKSPAVNTLFSWQTDKRNWPGHTGHYNSLNEHSTLFLENCGTRREFWPIWGVTSDHTSNQDSSLQSLPGWAIKSHYDCTLTSDWWPSRALQQDECGASLNLWWKTSDRLDTVRTAADVWVQCKSPSIHGQDAI